MKFIKKFNESSFETVNEGNSDYRRELAHLSKDMQRNECKEFYLIGEDRDVQKFIIPEEFRGDFEEQYTGGDYGTHFKDTAEFVEMYANDSGATLVIFDYQIDEFIENLQSAKSSDGYDCSDDA